MKKIYNFLLVALMVALVSTSLFAKVPRNMLMEDHTGAWCGWCVLGNQAMEDMLVKYNGKFIPVALHNGDKMVVSNFQATLASKIGITGYPSGTLNRMPVTAANKTAVPVHPSYWEQVCADHENDMSIADVDVTYTLDKTTKQLSATVTCTLTEDYAGQLAFNLWVMADNLTGSGTGWDQANYLSGNASYKNHPYYGLSNPVKNFYHMNVMVDMLGGPLGATALFPESPAKAGTKYTKTFTADLSKNTFIQDINDVWVVGLVQETGSKMEILNSKMSGKKMPKPQYAVTATETEVYLTGETSKNLTKAFTFENKTTQDLTVDFTVTGSTPSDWKNTLDVTNAVVKAGASKVVTLTSAIGTSAAYGNVTVTAKAQDGTDYYGKSSSAKAGILTNGLEGVIYHFDDGRLQPILDVLNVLAPIKAKMAVIPYNAAASAAYSKYNFKVIIVPETFNTRGTIINNTPLLTYLATARDAGANILMTSMIDMFFAAGNYSSLMPNTATVSFFKTNWGISGPSQGNPFAIGDPNAGTLVITPIVGVAGEFTAGMTFNINEYNSASFPYYSFWADQISIVDAKKAFPILKYNSTSIPEANKTAAVKIITPTNKNIYMGFTFDLMKDLTVRATLFGNMVAWLAGATDVEDFNNLNSANISVYPNPVINRSTVSFELAKDASSSDIYVVDLNGNRVMDLSTSAFTSGINYLNVDATNLASGKYYVITNVNGRISHTPLVITK